MAEKTKLWYLESFNLFQDLPKPVIREISDKTVMCKMFKDEFIYFEEDPAGTLYFLKEGKVKIGIYSQDGREIIKTILQPGEIFGELSLFGEGKRNEFARAMEEVKVCKMSKVDFQDLMRKNNNLSLKVNKLIGFRLRKVESKLESLVFKDARSRIIDFLREQANQRGQKVGFEIIFKNHLTHQEIANLTATTRQTVTSVLNELRKDNKINFNRKQILIRDLGQLN